MGGGRSGLFPGTRGASPHQQSLFPDPIEIRHRGATFIPAESISNGMSTSGRHKSIVKLRVLTEKEVLKRCMEYRLGAISEAQFVDWLQRVLANKRYYIEFRLRAVLITGLARLKNTKETAQTYNQKLFLIELERLEIEINTN